MYPEIKRNLDIPLGTENISLYVRPALYELASTLSIATMPVSDNVFVETTLDVVISDSTAHKGDEHFVCSSPSSSRRNGRQRLAYARRYGCHGEAVVQTTSLLELKKSRKKYYCKNRIPSSHFNNAISHGNVNIIKIEHS